jgi:hypothetical protein
MLADPYADARVELRGVSSASLTPTHCSALSSVDARAIQQMNPALHSGNYELFEC